VLDVTKLLEEIKASPYKEVEILAPHTGMIEFAAVEPGTKVAGSMGVWKEKPGTLLATIERERNKKNICSPLKGEVASLKTELNKTFVSAGTHLATLRHYLSKDEVLEEILKQALYLFRAPERAKYYFVPEIDKKIKASGPRSITARDGMEMFIMSRMKREAPVFYSGPEGIIYAVYFQYNDVLDAEQPLIGVCSPDQFQLINDVVVRVQTEWEEQE